MDSNKVNVLITGGAGFIGSNLVKALLNDERVEKVRVLDNLSNGFKHNIEEFLKLSNFEFIEGDIRDYETCKKACKDMDLVSHQAALGSVPRSIKDPRTTDSVNIGGTLNIFQAIRECKVKRIVFAASSSTYGDSKGLPKVEHVIGKPLSPYAITKYVNELYADVFARTYNDFEYVGLRYFNVFGPKQDPNGAYAAVIPLFMKAAVENTSPTINGDGEFSRDFTFVDNAVQANIRALFISNEKDEVVNEVYNVACGERTTLNQLWSYIQSASGNSIPAIHGPNRVGDIPHSLASIDKAKSKLLYDPEIQVKEGLRITYQWFVKNH
ncbi:MAG: SDR family oxidoreductase [Saprospiraceae bacterium]|nr:SDR family oxidoreductase [Saprospiraceae bacterium]